MSSDQDGCEWVSVLLVPAYPGSPGPKAIKRLCVCVSVCVCCNFSVEETVLCTVPQVVQNLQQAASRAKRLKSAGSAQEKPAVAPKPKKKGTTKRASRGSEHESVNAATVADAADVRRPAMAIVYPQPSMVCIHSVHTHTPV